MRTDDSGFRFVCLQAADFAIATRLTNKKIPAGCSRTGRDAKTRAIAWGYAERAPEETVELDTSGGFELVQVGEHFRVRQPEIS